MQRRTVLATLGTLLPLAGCVTDGASTTTTTTEPATTDPPNGTTTHTGSTYESADLQTTKVECASGEQASPEIAFEDSVITITGTIIGSDLCSVASLDTVVHDEAADQFDVTIETVREASEDTVCGQCVSAVDYQVTATFSAAAPEVVHVYHRQGDEVEQVAEASRP